MPGTVEQFCVILGSNPPPNKGGVTMELNTITHGIVKVDLTEDEYACVLSMSRKINSLTTGRPHD